ncbi:MAG TPA: iron transporter FeoB [Bacteroidetes bacterium]|nr:iron transporter FeoB [Bacteroidota bacterium]
MSNTPNANCEDCPVHNLGNLTKLGINMSQFDFVVALAGNPNTGKSTVFNALTGLRQHTGNWPGKTVTRAEGGFVYGNKRFKLVDLPGTYSLLSTSTDEEVARDFILFGQPDVTVIVVDATRLERNLNLVLQVLEITDRAVVCVNLMDEAKRHHIEIDTRRLAKELGVPVVAAAARQGEGISELLQAMYEVVTGSYICRPHRLERTSPRLEKAISELTKKIKEEFPKLPNSRWIALRLLEGDQRIIDSINNGELGNLSRSDTIPSNA